MSGALLLVCLARAPWRGHPRRFAIELGALAALAVACTLLAWPALLHNPVGVAERVVAFGRQQAGQPQLAQEAERELAKVLEQEAFDGGTDIKRGLLDAANYMARHARRDARHAMVILTDDQTERDRDDAAVMRAVTHAECVLSALIAPDALHTGSASQPDNGPLARQWRDMIPRELRPYFDGSAPIMIGPQHTHSAGTSEIARQSGGDSMPVEGASALENTLARIRERYALYFYLPEGVKPGDERAIEVELSEAARRRYPGAEVRYRRSYLAPNGPDKSSGDSPDKSSNDSDDAAPILISLPAGAQRH